MSTASLILVIHAHLLPRDPLCERLEQKGYHLVFARTPEQAAEVLRKNCALVLLEVEAAAALAPDAWQSLGQLCRKNHLPCLVFSTSGLSPQQQRQLVPFACCLIRRLNDGCEVAYKVASQIRIHQMNRQLEQLRRRLVARDREQEEDLLSAALIQRSLVPAVLPAGENYNFASSFIPYEKIGGDLFSVQQLDEETYMAYIFDVGGHGISSAMVSVSVYQSLSLHTGRIVKRVFVRPPYYKILTPAEVLSELESEYPFERFEKFFSIAYLLMDASGQVRFASAGHPPPLLLHRDGSRELLSAGGPIIGMGAKEPFEEQLFQLSPGDRLYLYSDGIPEYMNASKEFFGEERLFEILESCREQPLQHGCDRVIEEMGKFGDDTPWQDDLTLLAIEFLG